MPNFHCPRGDCQQPFVRVSQLEEHLRLHDNNLIPCHYCPWKGRNQWDLIDHMNHHFKIRPFKCSFCDLLFYSAAHRNTHETCLHEKISDRYKCDQCPFVTHSIQICYKHKAAIHR